MAIEVFKLHVADVHCKHIIFGGSPDNGYARMLGPYMGCESDSKRITMLEGPPFAPELSYLVPHFSTVSFATVFRNIKLPNRRVSFSTTPPKSISPKPQTWASTVTARPTTSSGNTPTQESVPTFEPEMNRVPRNIHNQRVDLPPRVSQPLVIALKNRKLCNNYHLTDNCPFPQCKHAHGKKLEGLELSTLRWVARLAPCKWGLECNDPNCFSGHRCMYPDCNGSDCRFSYDMHNVDIRVASH